MTNAEHRCLSDDSGLSVSLCALVGVFLLLGVYGGYGLRSAEIATESAGASLATLIYRAAIRRRCIVFALDEVRVTWAVTTGRFEYEAVQSIHWRYIRATTSGVAIKFVNGRYFDLLLTEEAANGVGVCIARCRSRAVDTAEWLKIR